MEGKFTLLTCAEHLDEVLATLQKPRVANLIKPYKAGRLVNQIKKLAEDVGQLPRLRRSPDAGDNYLLALAEAGGGGQFPGGPGKRAVCSPPRHKSARIIRGTLALLHARFCGRFFSFQFLKSLHLRPGFIQLALLSVNLTQ